jgi:hypothetical protein
MEEQAKNSKNGLEGIANQVTSQNNDSQDEGDYNNTAAQLTISE